MIDLTCRELIDFIDGYVDDRLEPAERRAFESHLAICPECQDYLKTYRESIAVFRTICAEETSVPEEVPADLVNGVLAAIGRRGASRGD